MENYDLITSNGVQFFNGLSYTTWKVRMRIYTQDLDFDVWKSMDNGVIYDNFDKQSKKEITQGFSKSYIEKVIYYDRRFGIKCSPCMK